ncbi:carbohydrate ABC transporter permease [Candidatus Mycoplasma mahonii]|uniref:carbohydrate ABC transporter permease n=1 Tax=Candidatus Mycoplasma mahonii TaxID=3004105 RepID=UPI0026EF0EAC|nr:carbohydrate ABC transporter permease [Candidatus Mycoplasma mahonii]WKX02640.1 carbohydrate ABC transporter permease [Candidatus Mycoplasma mahonii]
MFYTKEEISKRRVQIEAKNAKWINVSKLTFSKIGAYSILISYVFISVYPFFWALFTSFKDPHLLNITGLNPIPKMWTTKNYTTLFNGAASDYIVPWMQNTIIYSLSSSLLNATLNLLGGYALAQIALKGKRIIMSYFMVSILVPSQATFVPTYYIFQKIGIIDINISPNFFILMIVFSGMANIVLTFMARQFFMTQTNELEQAGSIEGYNRIQVFFKVTIRKMLPLFFTQIVLVFMGSWNNYLTFTLFATGDPNKMTINSGVLVIARTAIDKEVGYGQMLAMSNISFAPMMLIYLISLKVQLRGIKGGNK